MARNGATAAHGSAVLVVGLGRFGSALSTTLMGLGYEVLAVDTSARLVQSHASLLTHVVEADATDPQVLKQLGAHEFGTAVVAIGTSIEPSVLATAALVDVGIPNVWAKAITDAHRKILQRVGAHKVILPEAEMGERVAHLVTGRLVDYIELEGGFVLGEVQAPRSLAGQTLAGAGLRNKFRVTVVCVKPEGQPFTYATADTVIGPRDLLLVAGTEEDVERFVDET